MGYQVKADLPGMKKEDIKVNINDKTNVLTLSATKSDEDNQVTDAYKRRERYFGSVSRSIRLPENSNLEAIECGYQDEFSVCKYQSFFQWKTLHQTSWSL